MLLILLILIGMTFIPLGDTAAKLLMQEGVSPTFITWSRLLMGFLVLLPFCRLAKNEVKLFFDWRLLLRAGLFIGALSLILTALDTESLADVFGAFFIGPIVSYFLAAIVLKERITLLRSILLLIGFGGALLVIKPGFGMTLGLGLAALAGCFYGCLMVANRWVAGKFRPRLILLTTLFIGSLVLTPMGSTEIPASINAYIAGLLLLSALSSAMGNLIIIEASRKLPASVVAPFIYTQLIAATVFSVVVFNSWPDMLSLLGLSILFVSGMASFILSGKVVPDQRLKRQKTA
ncbi:MAG: DMT family transporter [Pontibacterium sp.]